MPDDSSRDTCAALARDEDPLDEVHVGYLPVPPLHRLMELRDALVALNGPLGSDPGLQANLRKRLINDDTDNRVLGKLNSPIPP